MHPDCGFMGLKMLKKMQAADKATLFPDLMLERHQEMMDYTGRICATFRSRRWNRARRS